MVVLVQGAGYWFLGLSEMKPGTNGRL